MLYLVIAMLLVLTAVRAAPLIRLQNPMRELDRWWHARHLTNSWAIPATEGPADER